MPQSAFQESFFRQVGDFSQILDVLQLLPGAMYMIKDIDSRYVYMSQPLRRAIHRESTEDVVGLTDYDLFPKIIAESFRQNDLLVFRDGHSLVNEIHCTCFFSHAPKWSFSSKYPLRDKAGNVIGLVTLNEPYDNLVGQQSELGRFAPAIDHVVKNYSETITVMDLAGLCGMSSSHFTRIFKERLNITPYGFVEQVRMYHAIEALKRGSASITQIAIGCGFYDHSAFVKRFRKFTGTTPLRFRRGYLSQSQGKPVIVVPSPKRSS